MTTISLKYTLRDLPSSQHRAGLAGLVEILKWREQLSSKKGVAKIVQIERTGAEFEFDEAGIADVFDIVYAAAEGPRQEAKPRKNDAGDIKPPLYTEEREVVSKTGKTSIKTYYFYPEVVPHGAFLLHRDPSRSDSNGLWVKLWRDFTWSIMRGVPATR
ncbi:MAG: hypothetical protein JKY56_02295, partial [Kofleriaceae bacterium]|nr:hypothetical protein [Kofleriaceae bacterium]